MFVGGGVIGLACAWRAAQAGARVCVLERAEPPAGATNVAAGMLAPVSELSFGERDLLEMMLASGALWPEFVADVEAAGGVETGYERGGALHVALDRDEAGELRRRHELQQELGLEAEWLTPRRCRELEPGLTPTFVGGVLAGDEASVDPRRLALALAAALREAGGELRTGTEVVDGLWDGNRLIGVRTAPTGSSAGAERAAAVDAGDAPSAETRPGDEETQTLDVHADTVVLCNGAWSGVTPWLPEEARPPVRPVKGEVVELRPREGDPVPSERIIASERVYLVPRPDGRLIVGATQEERGFDTVVTAGGVHELLREAYRVLPDVAEMEMGGMIAGLRPGTPDNLPIVGRGAVDGLLLATGHFRNGIMLAPLTAEAVAATLTGAEPPAAIGPADPRRSSLVRNTSPSDERTGLKRPSLAPHVATSDERTGMGAPR
ncbi:MAG TPA: FAD-dependent oxidoreductase [Solirubrobacterales bacterium]|nr:FAD-dependent oxidoreductase [Solirubrobacterales bacterium]